MKYLKYSLIIAALFSLVACGGGAKKAAKQELESLPSWYLSPPKDNSEFLYATASSVSTRRETSRQKATVAASAEMARKLSVKVEALQKLFNEEITSGADTNYDEAFTNATKTIANQKLIGLDTEQMTFVPRENGTQYECFVLVKLPVGEARSSLDNALSRERELYVKFKESKAFQELQEDISRLGEEGN